MFIDIEGINGSGKDFILNRISNIFHSVHSGENKYPLKPWMKRPFRVVRSKPVSNFLQLYSSFKDENKKGIMTNLELGYLFLREMSNVSDNCRAFKSSNDEVVFSSRWLLGNLVYSIYNLEEKYEIEEVVSYLSSAVKKKGAFYNIIQPDAIFYVDADPVEAMERMEKSSRQKEISKYEKRLEDLTKVRDLYLEIIDNTEHPLGRYIHSREGIEKEPLCITLYNTHAETEEELQKLDSSLIEILDIIFKEGEK